MIVHCKPLRYINVSNLVSVGEFEFCLAYSSDLSLPLPLSLSLSLSHVKICQFESTVRQIKWPRKQDSSSRYLTHLYPAKKGQQRIENS